MQIGELQNTNLPFIMPTNFTERRHDHEDTNCDS